MLMGTSIGPLAFGQMWKLVFSSQITPSNSLIFQFCPSLLLFIFFARGPTTLDQAGEVARPQRQPPRSRYHKIRCLGSCDLDSRCRGGVIQPSLGVARPQVTTTGAKFGLRRRIRFFLIKKEKLNPKALYKKKLLNAT